MRLFKSNHDLQICIDQYACAQYICGYLTKNESVKWYVQTFKGCQRRDK